MYTDYANSRPDPNNDSVSPDTALEATEEDFLTWLHGLGFTFDPFAILDAAADPNLGRYLIHHDAFAAAWGNHISFVLAPPGGGKTALRVRVTEACYIGQETNRPFPIPYTPPFLQWRHSAPSLDEHLAALTRAGAIQLLLSLAYRPHWLLRLDRAGRQAVYHILHHNLPGPLAGYLELCRQAGQLTPLLQRFNPAFLLPDPPATAVLHDFCRALEKAGDTEKPAAAPAARWSQFIDLLQLLGFNDAVYILFDGLDAAPETVGDMRRALTVLQPLLDHASAWQEKKIYLKAFLPAELEDVLRPYLEALPDNIRLTKIHWNAGLLVDLIQQRVTVATEGDFTSLDAIAAPDARSVERQLADIVFPLPREMLVLVRQLLWTRVARSGPAGKINSLDIEETIDWYRRQQMPPLAEAAPTIPNPA